MKRLTLTLTVLGCAAGCSLINSFDDVKPAATTATGGSGGGGAGGASTTGGAPSTGGKGGTEVDAGGDSSVTGGSSGTGGTKPGAGGGAGAGGTSPKDGGGDAFTPGGPTGAIVVYDNSNMKSRLWVLDPADGSKISLEDPVPTIAAIAYDVATDLWYFFEQTTSATADQLVVRELDVTNGKWRNRGAPVTVPVAVPPVAVLNGKIGYLSTSSTTTFDAASYTLTVLDTQNPAAVKVSTSQMAIGDSSLKIGLTGSPSVGGTAGGTLTVALLEQGGGCDATTCALDLLRVTVNASVQADNYDPTMASMHTTVGQVVSGGGSAALTFNSQSRADVVVLPPTDGTALGVQCTANTMTLGSLQEYKTNATHDPLNAQPTTFTMGSVRATGVAYDPCDDVVFLTSLSEQRVWAIPLDVSGTVTPGTLCVTEPGAFMVYEPYTHILLRASNSGALEAYDINDTTPTAPTISHHKFTTPPGFSAAGTIAVRGAASCTP